MKDFWWLKLTSTLLSDIEQPFVQKGTIVLDESCRTWWEESGCVLCLSLLSAFLLWCRCWFCYYFTSTLIKKHLHSSFLKNWVKLVLALFPNVVLQFLTTLTKSSQTFQETGVGCYFIKVYKLSERFLMYPLLFIFRFS